MLFSFFNCFIRNDDDQSTYTIQIQISQNFCCFNCISLGFFRFSFDQDWLNFVGSFVAKPINVDGTLRIKFHPCSNKIFYYCAVFFKLFFWKSRTLRKIKHYDVILFSLTIIFLFLIVNFLCNN